MARICVFCSSSARIDPVHVALAAEVGALLAARGHELVSGGGRVSMMGAVAHAAREGGARTLGVIPRALVGLEVGDTDADELVVAADMRERKARMDASSDAFLALPGGLGTLEELLEIWVARSLGMHTKPVVVLDPCGAFAPLRHLVTSLTASGFVHADAVEQVVWTDTAAAALDAVETGLRSAAPAGAASAEELLEADL